MPIDDRFSKNRSLYRKVYTYGLSRRPDIRQFVDLGTDTTRSMDFQKILRDRDFFLINQHESLTFPPPEPAPVEYLEVTVPFSSSIAVDIVFPISFSQMPFLAFEPRQSQSLGDGEEGDNLAWWVSNLSTTGFRANFSAPFVGEITYRGVWSPGTYPVYVNRITDLSGSYGWVSAGSITVNNLSTVTMSWGTLTSLPEFVNSNPVGLDSDDTMDIGQAIASVSTSGAVNELSVPFTGVIHFLALDTTTPDTDPFTPDPDLGVP